MARRGDEPTLNDVCLAVAVVAEAMARHPRCVVAAPLRRRQPSPRLSAAL